MKKFGKKYLILLHESYSLCRINLTSSGQKSYFENIKIIIRIDSINNNNYRKF